MSKIFLKPMGGLCNRIRAIDSVLLIANESGKRLVVIWEKNNFLNCSYTDLFVNSPAFDLVETKPIAGMSYPFFPGYSPTNFVQRQLFKFTQSKCRLRSSIFFDELMKQLEILRPVTPEKYVNTNAFDKSTSEIFSATVDALKKNTNYIAACWRMVGDPRYRENFTPVAEIASQVDKLTERFSTNTYGLYIRGTDAATVKRYSSVEAFEDRIRTIIAANSDASFFLASDEPAIKAKLIAKYQSRVFFLDQPSYARDTAKNI